MALPALGDSVDPGDLNTWMKKPYEEGGYLGTSVNWRGANTRSPQKAIVQWKKGIGNIEKDTNGTSLTVLDEALNKCQLIIVHVRYKEANGKIRTHWVLVYGKNANGQYMIRDPRTFMGQTTLDGTGNYQYSNRFWEYVTVQRKE
jgi:hypothetical protein